MVVVGRAMTLLEADCAGEQVGHSGRAEPFGLMFRALDQLRPQEVYEAAGGSLHFAFWGGLMSTRAMPLGAAGAVLEGCHRDTREILARGRVLDYRCRVEFDNAAVVDSGDLIVGDLDGGAGAPSGACADIIQAASAKMQGEDRMRAMLGAGMTTETIFAETGIM